MLKEFLQYVVNEVSKPEQFTFEGRRYSSRSLSPITPPLEKPLIFNTLQSLMQYANQLGFPSIIQVIDEKEVHFYADEVDAWKQREVFAKATTALQPERFPFGKFLAPDEFAIQLRTRFDMTPDLETLIAVTSNISYASNIEVSDDGLTQTVGQKAGVVLKSRAELPSLAMLKPYRTFLEAGQPESPFIVRARKNHSDVPELALFEADGGAWRLQAVQNIVGFIGKKVHEQITVLW